MPGEYTASRNNGLVMLSGPKTLTIASGKAMNTNANPQVRLNVIARKEVTVLIVIVCLRILAIVLCEYCTNNGCSPQPSEAPWIRYHLLLVGRKRVPVGEH